MEYMGNIDRIVTEHRRRLKVLLENQDLLRGIEKTDDEIDFGEQQLKILTDITVDGEQIEIDLISTVEGRKLLTDILTGDNTQGVAKHVVGTGEKQNRREVNSLGNKTTPNSQNHTLTDNGDTLTVSSEIDISKNATITELGVETTDGNIIQYTTNL